MSMPIFVAEDDELRLIVEAMQRAREGCEDDLLFVARELKTNLRHLRFDVGDPTEADRQDFPMEKRYRP